MHSYPRAPAALAGTRILRPLLCALIAALGAGPAQAQDSTSEPARARSRPRGFASMGYWVSGFDVDYGLPHSAQPPLEDLLALEVGLIQTPEGYRAPRSIDTPAAQRLGSLPAGRARFFTDALLHINRTLLAEFERRGIGGVVITLPDIEEGTGRDLRGGGESRLRLRIWVGRISDVATIAEGERFAGLSAAERTNRPAHAWMIEAAPVAPGGERGLLFIDELDAFAWRLSRHPGRRVDAQLSPGSGPAATRVGLRVAENRPWMAYAQYSDTGTPSTTRNRERFGYIHHQLSGRDDILRLDYVTGDFDSLHAVYGSYEMPLWRRDGPRLRIGSSYTQYNSSELAFQELEFEGRQAHFGIEAIYPVFQHRELFVDLFAGFKWQYLDTENLLAKTPFVTFDTNYWLPKVGASIERLTHTSQLRFTAFFEFGIATDGREALGDLGRPDVAGGFSVFRWNGVYSAFLEPLLNPAGWRDPRTPLSSTLAHEFAISCQGQWAMNNRLIPQQQQGIGGLLTVRGYPQALVAGDTVHVATLEYRFHLPRVLRPGSAAVQIPVLGNFRTSPPHVYGLPDWDFILKGFFDFGHVAFVDRFPSTVANYERATTLVSAGVGAELHFMKYLSARVDAGFALDNAHGRTEFGASEVHALVTVRY